MHTSGRHQHTAGARVTDGARAVLRVHTASDSACKASASHKNPPITHDCHAVRQEREAGEEAPLGRDRLQRQWEVERRRHGG